MALLSGLRVVDFTAAAAGPFVTMMLADLGAEVLKIEPPVGDHLRHWGSWHIDNKSLAFLAVNRNKRSIVLDLKTEKGKEQAYRLIADADIVVEAFADGVAERLGIDYESCKRVAPDVIYCSVSGFGRSGPMRHGKGMDMMLQAYSGIMSYTGEPGRPPVRIAVSAIDLMTGAMGFAGILAALRDRDQTGKGQQLEVSLYDTSMNLLLWAIPQYTATGRVPPKLGGEFEHLYPYGVFEAADAYFFLGVATPALWRTFCDVLDLGHLYDDERFATNASRIDHRDELRAILGKVFADKALDELIGVLDPAGVMISKIRDVAEAVDDPHAAARQMILPLPGYPDIKVAAAPLKMERGFVEEWTRPPDLGEHTAEYLTEF